MYLASADESATVFCFFDAHEIVFEPRRKTEVSFAGLAHESRNNSNSVNYIRPCICEIDQRTNKLL
ncbi:Retrovirus-related Pol polyprotein from transposon TNT 1-94 [Senna tora]|uniref:Retrovirus-related Pol polyprotein from transposon TNT 1-94 n=1 Tax=Senna tora TaxID=362788 RepID=A0A835CHP2_9FABA|nr:Retrovirus-related Pol polyprotein from transposon TNT 1-94 [Senna tora]